MCGIFGAIGNNINPGIIRALAIANRARGIHSLGFFNNTGLFVKRAGDPVDCLGLPKIDSFIESSACKGWFVAGHTRHATLGAVTTRNAHPFRYGRYIGCHNGIVDIPRNRTMRLTRNTCLIGSISATVTTRPPLPILTVIGAGLV